MFKEFRQFILRGNVVDLAVGVVIGAAFSNIVNSIVRGFINPLISFASTGALQEKSLCVGGYTPKGVCKHPFGYGEVISSMISFVLIAAVVFFLVVKPVNHLMARFKQDEPKGEAMRDCPECCSRIPQRAKRCSFCTATVQA